MSYVCQEFSNSTVSRFLIGFKYEKAFRDLGSGFVVKICVMKKDDEKGDFSALSLNT